MFENQHIVITGGSSGLGLDLAKRLAAEGARLSLIARDPNKLEDAKRTIMKHSPNTQVTGIAVDVCDEAATQAAMEQFGEQTGGIDMLINSAGILREGYFETLPMAAFREVMEINYFGVLHATRAALPYLKISRGRLVNIASMAGMNGVFGYTPYCSAKHALVGLTESLRFELEPQGIKLHLVCPGEFDSPMVDKLNEYRTPENRAHTLSLPKTSVDVITEGTLAGIRAGQFMIVPGSTAKAAAFSARHFPGLARKLGDRAVRKARTN